MTLCQDWYCVVCGHAGVVEVDNEDAFGAAASLYAAHTKKSPDCPAGDIRLGATYDEEGDIRDGAKYLRQAVSP